MLKRKEILISLCRFFKHIALDLLDNMVTTDWKARANAKSRKDTELRREFEAQLKSSEFEKKQTAKVWEKRT